MSPLGRWVCVAVVASVVGLSACSTADPLFPPNGSVALDLRDSGLSGQATSPGEPRPPSQVAIWVLEAATGQIEGVEEPFPFLQLAPCTYFDNILAITSLGNQCGATGLVLGTEGTRTAAVRVTISGFELERADRPSLPAGGDFDGDGVPNDADNCPIVVNPGQEDTNADGFGDACSELDLVTLLPEIPDRDADGVVDAIDNCLWIPNPPDPSTQPDSNGNGIGDACERSARVLLAGGTLTLECDTEFTVDPETVTTLIVDFDDTEAVTCDPSFSTCTLDPTRVTIRSTSDPIAPPASCRVAP